MPISQGVIDEVEEIKAAIDWSWATIAKRLDWSSAYLAGFRGLKQPIAPMQLQWLRDIRAAIDALPPPGPESFIMSPNLPQDVKVMLLEDIAAKLVDEYFALDGQDGSPEEIAGARYMVGRLAERCGVADEVREAIKVRQVQTVLTPPERHFPLPPLRVEGTTVTQAQYYGDPEAPPVPFLAPRPSIGNPFATSPRPQRVPMED